MEDVWRRLAAAEDELARLRAEGDMSTVRALEVENREARLALARQGKDVPALAVLPDPEPEVAPAPRERADFGLRDDEGAATVRLEAVEAELRTVRPIADRILYLREDIARLRGDTRDEQRQRDERLRREEAAQERRRREAAEAGARALVVVPRSVPVPVEPPGPLEIDRSVKIAAGLTSFAFVIWLVLRLLHWI